MNIPLSTLGDKIANLNLLDPGVGVDILQIGHWKTHLLYQKETIFHSLHSILNLF